MKLEYSRQLFKKYTNTKFHENSSRGSLVFLCGQTDGQTEMTKLVVPFFAILRTRLKLIKEHTFTYSD